MRLVTAQICGLILLSLIAYLSFRKKRIILYCVKAYYLALICSMVCLTLDIVSVLAITQISVLGDAVVEIVCKLYLVTLVCNAFTAFNYLMRELYYLVAFKVIRQVSLLILAVSSLAILVTPINIHNGKSVYTYGLSVQICYACSLIFVISSFLITVILRKRINADRRKCVHVWMGVLALAAVIQFFNNELLLVGYASAIGLTFLFSQLENPMMYVDADTGLYNVKAIKDYILERMFNNKPIYGFTVTLNTFARDLTYQESKKIIIEISDFFLKLPNVYSFRTDAYTFVVLMHKSNLIDTYLGLVQSYFNGLDDKLLEFSGITVNYAVLRDENIFNRVDEFINMYYYVRSNHYNNEVLDVDRDLIDYVHRSEEMKAFITKALNDDRVQVFYQPIFDTRANKFTSAEALLRIVDEEGNYVSTQEYIEVAEESGLVIPLGERIFEKVCQFISKNDIQRLGVDYIEINLSPVQCTQKDLYETFKQLLDLYKISPNQINLEITETAKLSSSKQILSLINSFVDAGVKFSLDDFGTGSSNLEYITTLPIHIIKFDYKLTQSFFNNARTKIIFKHLVPMIRELNLEIVCEGVESNDMLAGMLALGIEHIQGYYFSKPVNEQEYVKYLEQKNLGIEERNN